MNFSTTQIDSLLGAIYDRYGYDFQDYARASIERRLEYFTDRQEMTTFDEVRDRVLNDPDLFVQFVQDLTVQVTEMFRDPQTFQAVREQVLPVLATYPRIKVWHAGCSTGEEAYAMAILLHECKLLDRSIIYATDINERSLKTAKRGVFPIKSMQDNSKNYLAAGGQSSLSEYYKAVGKEVKFSDFLKKKILFSFHNLAVDTSFAEVNLVVCRNVLIYFNSRLQDQVLELFESSLVREGFLLLGHKETLNESHHPSLRPFVPKERIYRAAG